MDDGGGTTIEILRVLAVFAVGRVVLGLLPPGRPGYHTLRGLPLTVATSLLLGGVVLSAQMGVFPRAAPLLHVAAWIPVALVRWLTLPGALVPRHDLPLQRAGAAARVLHAAAFLVACAALPARASTFPEPRQSISPIPILSDPPRTLGVWLLLIFVAHALAEARRPALDRALVLLGLSLGLYWMVPVRQEAIDSSALVLVGAGASFSVPWLRRGDRRAGVLAVIFFAVLVTSSANAGAIGISGLLALIAAAPGRARAWTAVASAIAVGVFALPRVLGGWEQRYRASSYSSDVLEFAVLVACVAIVAGLFRGAVDARRLPGRPRAAVSRETIALTIAVGLAIALVANQGWRGFSLEDYDQTPVDPLLLPLVPLAAVWIGVLVVRTDRADA